MSDIVPALRWITNEGQCDCSICDITREGADEIERLRSTGDALVTAVRNHNLTEAHLRAWEDLR